MAERASPCALGYRAPPQHGVEFGELSWRLHSELWPWSRAYFGQFAEQLYEQRTLDSDELPSAGGSYSSTVPGRRIGLTPDFGSRPRRHNVRSRGERRPCAGSSPLPHDAM